MKTMRLLSFVILVLAGLPPVALGFYAPDLQHWINRDPMGDLASVQLQTTSVLPSVENMSLLTEREKANTENNSLHVAASFAEWSEINANLYGGIANDAINHVDPMGLDANSYADCIERYRNPILLFWWEVGLRLQFVVKKGGIFLRHRFNWNNLQLTGWFLPLGQTRFNYPALIWSTLTSHC